MTRLSPRQRDVEALIMHGLSVKEIAKQLDLSPATAKTHVRDVLQFYGHRDRTQMLAIRYQALLKAAASAAPDPS